MNNDKAIEIKEHRLDNNAPIIPDSYAPHNPEATKIAEKKIGRATFIVMSRFNEGKEKDLVSTIARLIQLENAEGKPA